MADIKDMNPSDGKGISKPRKRFLCFMAAALLVVSVPAGECSADPGMWVKAGRGINNILFGWVEVFRHPVVLHEQGEQWPVAIAGGMLRGAGYAVVRTFAGVYETLTFPLPYPDDYKPLIYPVHVIPPFSAEMSST